MHVQQKVFFSEVIEHIGCVMRVVDGLCDSWRRVHVQQKFPSEEMAEKTFSFMCVVDAGCRI